MAGVGLCWARWVWLADWDSRIVAKVTLRKDGMVNLIRRFLQICRFIGGIFKKGVNQYRLINKERQGACGWVPWSCIDISLRCPLSQVAIAMLPAMRGTCFWTSQLGGRMVWGPTDRCKFHVGIVEALMRWLKSRWMGLRPPGKSMGNRGMGALSMPGCMVACNTYDS